MLFLTVSRASKDTASPFEKLEISVYLGERKDKKNLVRLHSVIFFSHLQVIRSTSGWYAALPVGTLHFRLVRCTSGQSFYGTVGDTHVPFYIHATRTSNFQGPRNQPESTEE